MKKKFVGLIEYCAAVGDSDFLWILDHDLFTIKK